MFDQKIKNAFGNSANAWQVEGVSFSGKRFACGCNKSGDWVPSSTAGRMSWRRCVVVSGVFLTLKQARKEWTDKPVLWQPVIRGCGAYESIFPSSP